MEPLWTDVGSFWVGAVNAIASTVIAIVAIVLSVKASRAEARRAEEATADAKRLRRAEFAHDFATWVTTGMPYLAMSNDTELTDDAWVETGYSLSARAGVLDSPGANKLLIAAREVRSAMEDLPFAKRLDLAPFMTNLLKFWAESWVKEPTDKAIPARSWVETAARGDKGSTS